MPAGDPGGNFAGTGGYGGNFGGYGGASNQSGSGGYGGTGGWGGQFGAGGYTAGLTGAGGFNANGLGNGSMYGSPNSPSRGTGWPGIQNLKNYGAAGAGTSPPALPPKKIPGVPPTPVVTPAPAPATPPTFPTDAYPGMGLDMYSSNIYSMAPYGGWSQPDYNVNLGYNNSTQGNVGGLSPNYGGASGGFGGSGLGGGGGGGGGWGGGSTINGGSVRGWANGGMIMPGQSGWVGERGPEFAQGMPGGGVAITPNHMLGSPRPMGPPMTLPPAPQPGMGMGQRGPGGFGGLMNAINQRQGMMARR